MPEALAQLATRPQYSSLERIKIEHARVGNDGATRLAQSTTLSELRFLSIGQCEIGIEGLCAILESPILSNVSYLDLGGNVSIGAEGEILAGALAASKHLGHLESLILDEIAFTDRAASRLAEATWPALKELKILPYDQGHSDIPTGFSTITFRGVEYLMSANWAQQLESLELSGHPIGDSGAEALARDKRLTGIKRLALSQTGITAIGLLELVQAYSQQLESIQMARCQLGDAGAAVISEAAWPAMIPKINQVDRDWKCPYTPDGLFFAGCDITDLGAEALIQSTTIPHNVPELFLNQSTISRTVVERLKKRYPKATVRF
jgi:hypothetical protein